MNKAYYTLRADSELTKENFISKLNKITNYKFSEKQLNMLETDVFNESNEE